MSDPDEVALARRAKFAKTWNINPLVAEIAEVLMMLGGSAHRNVVAERIALRRSRQDISEGLRRDIFQAFEAHCAGAARAGLPSLVHLPFGAGSHRWALTLDAQMLLQSATPLPVRPAKAR